MPTKKAHQPTVHIATAWPGNLTTREKEIAGLFALGYNRRQIAFRFDCNPKTIDTHRQKILAKLGLRHAVALTRFALRESLVSGAAEVDAPADVEDSED